MAKKQDTASLEAVRSFIFDGPLYERVNVDFKATSATGVLLIWYRKLIMDGHCPYCRQSSTFSRSTRMLAEPVWEQLLAPPSILAEGPPPVSHLVSGIVPAEISGGFHSTSLTCARDASHVITVWWLKYRDGIMKVGQYPSLADIANDDARIYDKYLSEDDRFYLHRAIGLAAHGMGIGAFSYLRRVFERQLTDTFHAHKVEKGWKDSDWHVRFDEKIELIKDLLPDFLVKNKRVYGIVSKGLHELSEDECLEAFPVLKWTIIEFLDDVKRVRDRQVRREAATKEIANIAAKASRPEEEAAG